MNRFRATTPERCPMSTNNNKLKVYSLILLIIAVLLQILDAITTVVALSYGATEVNPLMNFIFSCIGVVKGVVVTKVMVLLLLVVATAMVLCGVTRKEYKVLIGAMILSNIFYVVTVVNNFFVCYYEGISWFPH